MGNFSEEAVDLICNLVVDIDEDALEPEERDLRYRLVAVATIMGRTFPQFEKWRKVALRDDWGRLGWPPIRLAAGYEPEQFGPKWSEN